VPNDLIAITDAATVVRATYDEVLDAAVEGRIRLYFPPKGPGSRVSMLEVKRAFRKRPTHPQ
jgi:hypothetical protein